MKYNIGDQVKTVVTPGIGRIVDVKTYGKKGDYYQVEFSNYPAIWHPENEITLVSQPEQTQPCKSFESMDISSGLGIGGYGSDDYNIWTECDTIGYPERDGCKWGGTRYDERCANCGQITAICNDCELCENCHG